MNKTDKIYIAGHLGMVGSAILRNLKSKGFNNFILRSLDELDLMRQADVEAFFKHEKPDYVFLAAAKVGGIVANNTYRAQFIYENLMIENNIIHSSFENNVKKLLFLGSSCIYPGNAPQPLKEEYLLTGPLEETNEPYAIAKIAGIKLCENYYRQYGCDFISVMPTNLYGPNDNYNLEKSHVLPALIRKFHLGKCLSNNDWTAIRHDLDKRPIENISSQNTEEEILEILSKYGISLSNPATADCRLVTGDWRLPTGDWRLVTVTLWGTGQVHREFLHVDDMADACIHVMEHVSSGHLYKELNQTHINIGTGIDLTIAELAETVKNIIGFTGEIHWDSSHPDGTLKKQLNISLLNQLNWKHNIELFKGIESVYLNYIKH